MDIIEIVRKATVYIHSMYSEPITVSDIASHIYMSPSYFSNIFRNITGYTVKNYLNCYRLYCAAIDLLESDKPIIAIAYLHGFSSQQAFTRSFANLYGITPAKFRMQCPEVELFPPKTLWKENVLTMELKECFENVQVMHKKSFYVVGIEVDINYHSQGGTDPIGLSWDIWDKNNLTETIPNQVNQGSSLGITHSETADDTGKYITCTEVSTLDDLPIGMVGRRFANCDYAVFNTTVSIIQTGQFWRYFYTTWLPKSEYDLPDESLHDNYCTFNKYPAIEFYGKDFKDRESIIQVYAPVVKKK